MSYSPYQASGVKISPMLGRERLFKELCSHLTKPTPDHMCVVGPPLFGKSVLLNHLASHFNKGGRYVTSLYWDLGASTPRTDDEFRRRFAKKIKDALQSIQSELAECLELEDESLQDDFEDMEREGHCFLAVLDGFDHVFPESGITRNLWDYMLTLGQKDSLRLVTGSRSRPLELCPTEDYRTSHFWGIFYDTPLQVGCFEDRDWSGFLDPLKSRGITFDDSARKEIANWTGGVPVLAVALAEQILAEVSDVVTISKAHVDGIAKEMAEKRRGLLENLWKYCSIELRSELAALAKGEVPLSEVPDHLKRNLELQGFACTRKNNLRSSCRLMAQYAQKQAADVNNLKRLFGDADRFESNIQSLLELRLAQVRGADKMLMSHVEKAIRDLHEPTVSLTSMRSIAARALELIWDTELGPDRSLPEHWKDAKVYFVEQKQDPQKQDPFPEQSPFPEQNLGAQCGILRRSTEKKALQDIEKPTQLLVDHLHSVGNFGQHRDGSDVSVPIAAAFCMSAISLCESLAEDLARAEDRRRIA